MPTNDELWVMGLMTYDEYEAEEGRPPPDYEETKQIAVDLIDDLINRKGAQDAGSHTR
jgi:hypothetical protein